MKLRVIDRLLAALAGIALVAVGSIIALNMGIIPPLFGHLPVILRINYISLFIPSQPLFCQDDGWKTKIRNKSI